MAEGQEGRLLTSPSSSSPSDLPDPDPRFQLYWRQVQGNDGYFANSSTDEVKAFLTQEEVGKGEGAPFLFLSSRSLPETATATPSRIKWKKGELLGHGSFGSVYLGLDERTGSLLAVKQVGYYWKGSRSNSSMLQDLEQEISVMARLKHDNIVSYLGCQRDSSGGSAAGPAPQPASSASASATLLQQQQPEESEILNILMEYVPGGSISSLLSKFGRFSELMARLYSKQILLGLAYLHAHGVLHGDIKGANILVDRSGVCKLSDFGASRSALLMRPSSAKQRDSSSSRSGAKQRDSGGTSSSSSSAPLSSLSSTVSFPSDPGSPSLSKLSPSSSSMSSLPSGAAAPPASPLPPLAGSPAFMAPEVIRQSSSQQAGRKSDIWSLGCTVVEMLTGKPPYSHLDSAAAAMFAVAVAKQKPQLPAGLTAEAHSFLDLCFQWQPELRPTAAQLLQHPFISGPPPPSRPSSALPGVGAGGRPGTAAGGESRAVVAGSLAAVMALAAAADSPRKVGEGMDAGVASAATGVSAATESASASVPAAGPGKDNPFSRSRSRSRSRSPAAPSSAASSLAAAAAAHPTGLTVRDSQPQESWAVTTNATSSGISNNASSDTAAALSGASGLQLSTPSFRSRQNLRPLSIQTASLPTEFSPSFDSTGQGDSYTQQRAEGSISNSSSFSIPAAANAGREAHFSDSAALVGPSQSRPSTAGRVSVSQGASNSRPSSAAGGQSERGLTERSASFIHGIDDVGGYSAVPTPISSSAAGSFISGSGSNAATGRNSPSLHLVSGSRVGVTSTTISIQSRSSSEVDLRALNIVAPPLPTAGAGQQQQLGVQQGHPSPAPSPQQAGQRFRFGESALAALVSERHTATASVSPFPAGQPGSSAAAGSAGSQLKRESSTGSGAAALGGKSPAPSPVSGKTVSTVVLVGSASHGNGSSSNGTSGPAAAAEAGGGNAAMGASRGSGSESSSGVSPSKPSKEDGNSAAASALRKEAVTGPAAVNRFSSKEDGTLSSSAPSSSSRATGGPDLRQASSVEQPAVEHLTYFIDTATGEEAAEEGDEVVYYVIQQSSVDEEGQGGCLAALCRLLGCFKKAEAEDTGTAATDSSSSAAGGETTTAFVRPDGALQLPNGQIIRLPAGGQGPGPGAALSYEGPTAGAAVAVSPPVTSAGNGSSSAGNGSSSSSSSISRPDSPSVQVRAVRGRRPESAQGSKAGQPAAARPSSALVPSSPSSEAKLQTSPQQPSPLQQQPSPLQQQQQLQQSSSSWRSPLPERAASSSSPSSSSVSPSHHSETGAAAGASGGGTGRQSLPGSHEKTALLDPASRAAGQLMQSPAHSLPSLRNTGSAAGEHGSHAPASSSSSPPSSSYFAPSATSTSVGSSSLRNSSASMPGATNATSSSSNADTDAFAAVEGLSHAPTVVSSSALQSQTHTQDSVSSEKRLAAAGGGGGAASPVSGGRGTHTVPSAATHAGFVSHRSSVRSVPEEDQLDMQEGGYWEAGAGGAGGVGGVGAGTASMEDIQRALEEELQGIYRRVLQGEDKELSGSFTTMMSNRSAGCSRSGTSSSNV